MKLGVLKEQKARRVALVPATLPKLKAIGLDILVEEGAGAAAFFSDDAYGEHARVVSRAELLREADVVIGINPPSDQDFDQLKGKWVISQFQPFIDPEVADHLKKKEIKAFSLDMIPRTTLAQAMDVLSSMASIAGYKAVLEAASHLPRYFPMMITAAGSVKPAKVLVLGAGVAGLQAIATARRLGSMVEAFDTRAAAKEEVLSLGARFVEVEGAKDDTSAGGYAVEQSEEFLRKQREEVQKRAVKADVIITTAQVRGRQAPMLVPEETIRQMQPGSVIVDLAASTGGNCALTENEQTIERHGVTIIGNSELADLMPQDASLLYSNNVYNFLNYLIKEGAINLNLDDEIIGGAYITAATETKTN